jgi:hypothetical protein
MPSGNLVLNADPVPVTLAKGTDLNFRLSVVVDDGEGPVLDVALDGRVVELAPDQPLGVEDRVVRVHGNLGKK